MEVHLPLQKCQTLSLITPTKHNTKHDYTNMSLDKFVLEK